MRNIFLVIGIILTTVVWGQEYTIVKDKTQVSVLTPKFSERKTLKLRLSNGLEAYLISDPNLDRSGATLTVEIGSWSDPEEYPGMAHFLEHMLFLGTKKYPKESQYKRYITEHGGMSNAFTMNSATSYLFTIDHEAFDGALDQFSRFFIEPLFNPSGVSRELHAIDQEYAKNLDNDQIRELFVHKELVHPKHPYHNFNMGNTETLANVSQDTLKNWYNEHYSANLMHLVVYSTLPIESLKDLIVDKFQEIPNYGNAPFSSSIRASQAKLDGHYVYIEPIKNIRTLTLIWEPPAKFAEMLDSKPDSVVCHVLGHEGEKSLLAQLKREKLADELRCGGVKLGPNLFHMYIEIELTKEGFEDPETVITRCFQAIANLKHKGIPQYLFDELQAMSTMRYQYREGEEEFYSLMKHARTITEEKLETYPEKTQIIQKFDPDAVQELLGYLSPKHVRIDLMAPKHLLGVPLDKKEKWMGVSYALKPISKEKIDEWKNVQPHPNIGLPAPNPFMPRYLALAEHISEKNEKLIPHPELIIDDDSTKIYFAQDTHYQVPKISWFLEIKSPAIDPGDETKVVLTDLFVKSVKEALNEVGYLAKVADLEYKVKREENGIGIVISGYDDNALLLFEEILKHLINTRPTLDQFQLYKEILLRKYQNFSKESSLKQASEILKQVVYQDFKSEKEKAFAIRRVTYEKFLDYLDHVLDHVFIEGMLYGNMTQSNAQEIVDLIRSNLNKPPYPKEEHHQKEVVVLSEENDPYYIDMRRKTQGNAAILAVELPYYSFKNRAAQQILMQAIKEPFFAALRTKQQTGYIVFSYGDELERKLFNFFAVQSNTHEPRDLLSRFEQFIEGYLQEAGKSELTENQFDEIKGSLLSLLVQPPKNMYEMCERLNQFAFEYDGDFDWIEKRIDGLQQLTYPEFIQTSKRFLGRQNKRRLAVFLRGEIPEEHRFHYTRARSIHYLRSMSDYEGR